ncbi:DUF885 domain-containing protein [Pantoea rodasii]|uniref:DUF885 domain-containing protein n=1 Tax=Pantoea rodasii TaxID=1076549 RepID=UPI00068DBBDC|nr:DUF885 domain-containing protein [Pantoea rodasii]
MTELQILGEQLLSVRRRMDPLDDAFAMLDFAVLEMPAFTERFMYECIRELDRIENLLSEVNHEDFNIDYEIIKSQLHEAKLKCSMRLWGTFVVGYDHSPLGRISGLLPSIKTDTNEEKVRFLKILNSVDCYLDSCCNQLISSYTNGRGPLASNIYAAIERWNAIIACKGVSLIPESLDSELKFACTKIMEVRIIPSIIRYCDVLISIANCCRSDDEAGLCYIKDGRQDYIELVKINTDNFAKPDEIHALGIKEVLRIKSEIDALHMRNSENKLVPVTDNYMSAAEFLQDLYDLISEVDSQFSHVFTFSEFSALQIEVIPGHLAANSPAAYYVPGNGKNSNGTLYINPASMIGQPKGSANAVIYHETLPGHHAQFEYIRKLNLPDFRKASWFNCYIEGWALYVEDLAAEQGLYTTKNQVMGKLSQEIFRAARLAVDTGLHYYGWSKNKAINYLIENTSLSPDNATREVERYIEYPAQALSYATGKFHLFNLRNKYESFEGKNFNIKKFHHRILKHGAVPLHALSTKVMNELYDS